MEKKLYRSNEDRMIAGVCGGIGEYLNIDPIIIRLIWAISSIPTAMLGAVFAYIIAMIIIPVKY